VGFTKQPRIVTLKFKEGHRLHGLEVTCKGMNIGDYFKVVGLDGSDGESVAEVAQRLANSLISWTYERPDGTPIPPTVEEFNDLDRDDGIDLASAWIDALNGVHDADPLPQSSPSGGPSLVASIPMETLSPSPESSSVPA
jgi:hypothetical protein